MAVLSNKRLVLASCALLFIGLALAYSPRGLESGDSAYKIKQVRDLLATGSFQADYKFKAHDPAYRFYPALYPFLQQGADGYYLVFPYQLIAIFAPFYKAGGIAGCAAFILICSLLFLLVFHCMLEKLEATAGEHAVLLICAATGIAVLPYALSIYEHLLTQFMVAVAVFLFAFGKNKLAWPVSGGLFGMAAWFRPESILFVPLLSGALALARSFRIPYKKLSVFLFTAVIIFSFSFVTNLLVSGHLLGFRGKSGFALPDFAGGIERILTYLFLREHADTTLLKATPVLFLSLPVFLFWARLSVAMRVLLVTGWSYVLAVPFLISVPPAGQFGERYIMQAYPLLLLSTLPLLRLEKVWARRFLAALLIVLSLFSFRRQLSFVKDSFKFKKGLGELAFQIYAHENESVVVLRNRTLNTFFFADTADRIYFLAESDRDFKQLERLLRQKSVKRISIWHSRLRGEGLQSPQGDRFDFARTLAPPDFKGRAISEDPGLPFVEMRGFKL